MPSLAKRYPVGEIRHVLTAGNFPLYHICLVRVEISFEPPLVGNSILCKIRFGERNLSPLVFKPLKTKGQSATFKAVPGCSELQHSNTGLFERGNEICKYRSN